MPKGKKKSHKGGHRHFTSEDDLALEAEKARRQQEWRAKKGIESDEDEEEEDDEQKPAARASKPGELPPSESESDEAEDDDEEVEDKPKGVSHLIEIENPNRVKPQTKKVTSIAIDGQGPSDAPTLSRKEREELEKQQAKDRYQKLHIAGKTEEARSDLARLALIRKQREEAARKREEEKKAADDVKTAAEQRLLDKKQKSGSGDKK